MQILLLELRAQPSAIFDGIDNSRTAHLASKPKQLFTRKTGCDVVNHFDQHHCPLPQHRVVCVFSLLVTFLVRIRIRDSSTNPESPVTNLESRVTCRRISVNIRSTPNCPVRQHQIEGALEFTSIKAGVMGAFGRVGKAPVGTALSCVTASSTPWRLWLWQTPAGRSQNQVVVPEAIRWYSPATSGLLCATRIAMGGTPASNPGASRSAELVIDDRLSRYAPLPKRSMVLAKLAPRAA